MSPSGKREADSPEYRHLYGPVPSRRLGRSLGVDIVPHKVCSYDCVYCQLGRTTRFATTPKPLVSQAEVMPEIEGWLEQGGLADYITFAGSGEPTLTSGLGEMIAATKALCDIPVAVITNGSLLSDPEIRAALAPADVIVPSLDAGTADTFRAINRPAPGIDFEAMCEGLAQMIRERPGAVWLEVMLVKGLNDSEAELRALGYLIRRIQPKRVQLNTVDRPSRSGEARSLSPEELARVAKRLGGAEIIARAASVHDGAGRWEQVEDELVRLLSRRPCTLDDLVAVSGRQPHELLKHLQRLVWRGAVDKFGDTDPSYRCTSGGFHG